MDVSLRQLEQVVALDRHRHYGRAAEALGLSQPALSRSILAMEHRLGQTLFHRSRAGVTPTEAGRLLLHHARKQVAMTAELEQELDELNGRVDSRLQVVCGHYPAEMIVPVALGRVMTAWPKAQVRMEVADWSRGIQLLEQGVCTLGVMELSADSRTLTLQREPLNDEQLFAVVRRGHPLARRRRPTFEDLLSWPWSSSQIPPRAAHHFDSRPVAAGDHDDETGHFIPKMIASSLSTALKLVMETDLVGIAPLVAADPLLREGRLELVRFHASWMRLDYGFMWDEGKPLSAVTRAFMEAIRDAEVTQGDRNRILRAHYGVEDW